MSNVGLSNVSRSHPRWKIFAAISIIECVILGCPIPAHRISRRLAVPPRSISSQCHESGGGGASVLPLVRARDPTTSASAGVKSPGCLGLVTLPVSGPSVWRVCASLSGRCLPIRVPWEFRPCRRAVFASRGRVARAFSLVTPPTVICEVCAFGALVHVRGWVARHVCTYREVVLATSAFGTGLLFL